MITADLIRAEASRCVRCGACRAVCPTFSEELREGAAARGKISLAEAQAAGAMEPSPLFRAEMEQCLLCMACVSACPNSVRTDEVVIASRELMARASGGAGAAAIALRAALLSPALLTHGLKLASFIQGLIFERLPGRPGRRARIPLPLLGDGRAVPALARRFFLDDEAGRETGRGPSAAFFAGCMMNYIYTDTGKKTLALMERVGGRVLVPRGQACCGLPALGLGDAETARALAIRNMDAMDASGADVIVTACASCGSTFKEYYPMLFSGDPVLERRAREYASRIRDIAEFLVDRQYVPPRARGTVTYHEPCHLGRGMKAGPAARELLHAAMDTDFRAMEDAGRCCGFGGSFNLKYYGFSRKVLQKKVDAIENSGAATVVTGCPGCMMNIEDGLARAASGIQVRHIVDILG